MTHPNPNNKLWTRTCQECGYKQTAKPPSKPMTDAYANTKCRRCGSMALDYGKEANND